MTELLTDTGYIQIEYKKYRATKHTRYFSILYIFNFAMKFCSKFLLVYKKDWGQTIRTY